MGCLQRGIYAIDCARRVECKICDVFDMKMFLKLRTKTDGPKRNSKSKIQVNEVNDHVQLACENQHDFAPLQVRVLQAAEFVSSDFRETKTLSAIVKELQGNGKTLNEVTLKSVLKAWDMFSDHGYSTIPDEPLSPELVTLHDVTIDVDSFTAVFKHRFGSDNKVKNVESVLEEIAEIMGDDWSGFHTSTNYCANNDWIKAVSSGQKGGPTIEMHSNGERFRVRLPTPPGLEVLKIWIYSPTKMTHNDFITCVKSIAHDCAIKLLLHYDHSRLADALQSTKENKLHGGKACAVPGGFKFALGTALMFVEKYPGGNFCLETYNCKQKNMRFKMPAKGFGTDLWLNQLVLKMKNRTKHCDTMVKTICLIDRVAEMDPSLSRVGFGFEMR